MSKKSLILFVCEHGAAKSIVAATHFNKLAEQMNLDVRAIARGTNPDDKLSSATIAGLEKDDLEPTESVPRRLSQGDLDSARRVVTFCKLPAEHTVNSTVERWDNVPPVSENYEEAREAILARIHQLLSTL